MVAWPWNKLGDAERMERDILRAVRDIGDIHVNRRSTPSPTYTAAASRLMELYPKDGNLPTARLWVFVDSMVVSGDLLHFRRAPGEMATEGAARGITPKGERRLMNWSIRFALGPRRTGSRCDRRHYCGHRHSKCVGGVAHAAMLGILTLSLGLPPGLRPPDGTAVVRPAKSVSRGRAFLVTIDRVGNVPHERQLSRVSASPNLADTVSLQLYPKRS